MYVLQDEDLPEFVDSLRRYFPRSLQIFCQARNILRQKCFWPGTEVVVDRYPDYAVCMTRPVPGSSKYIPRPRNWLQCITIFAKSAEDLTKLLSEQDIVDWYRPICFSSIPSEYIPTILARADLTGHSTGKEEKYRSDIYVLKAEDLDSTSPPALPVGYRLGQLEMCHTDQVLREWNFAGRGGADIQRAYPFFHYLLTHDFPTSAVFAENGDLVAYCVYSPNGSISQGFVREDHRNRGFFQIVNRNLARKIFRDLDQEVTWAHVNNRNTASQRSFMKLGAKIASDWQTQVLEYTPYL